jgi:hypothetical protein
VTAAEHLLVTIGELLARDTEYPIDGTLLHAEVGQGFVSPSIFKDRPEQIVYRDPDLRDLGDALLALWEAQEGEDRWEELEYVIRDGTFEAAFTYPDAIDRDEEPLDRRNRIVRRHFGEKPIVYPPIDLGHNPPDDENDEGSGLTFQL